MDYSTVTTTIGIGIIGAGYMGKLHSVAMQAVGAVFNTELRPLCGMLCATTEAGVEEAVTNDDHAQCLCRFASGVMGHLYFSRVSTGRKMGYACEISGSKGAIRFDQEDQNALWLYKMEGPESERGFRKILTNPDHPDYVNFCLGPGHGTGYQDQLIIKARDFLVAIQAGQPQWPTFRDGMEVNRVIDAVWASVEGSRWVDV